MNPQNRNGKSTSITRELRPVTDRDSVIDDMAHALTLTHTDWTSVGAWDSVEVRDGQARTVRQITVIRAPRGAVDRVSGWVRPTVQIGLDRATGEIEVHGQGRVAARVGRLPRPDEIDQITAGEWVRMHDATRDYVAAMIADLDFEG